MKKQFLISLLLIGGLLLSCTADQTPLETSSAVSDGTAYPPLTDSDSADARYLGDYTSYRISDFDGSRAVADASVSSFVSGELLYLDIGNGFSCYDRAGERVAEYTFDGFDRGLNTGMALLSGGNFAVMESLDVPYLTVIGADGEILHEAAFPDTFLPGMPAVLRADGQHIYALQGNYLYIFDTALNLQTALFLPNDVGGGLHIAADGTVVLGTDADRLYTADPGTGTLSPYALPPLPETLSDAQVCFGLDGELYFADATGIYTVDETGEATEILSWASGGAVYSRSLFVADADTVFLYTENAPSGTAQFALLTPFSARDTSEARRILTLGILDSDENGYLASLIDRFNSTNEAYYVETVLYDMYNFRDAYRALTEAFLSSDGVPDMLCLFNAAYRNILGDMGDKNAFVDLTPYYADAVWGGLADACTSDGVLSFLPLGITVETLAVSSTLVGDGETLSLTDLYGMADALGAGQALFSDPKAAKNLYEQALWDFIDYENRDCAFDTDAFRDFIRFTERAETEYTDPTLGCFNQTYTMDANIAVSTLAMRDNLENGALLFMHLPLTHPKQYIAAKMMWGDTDFTLCGYPTAGGGGAAVTGAHFLGITSSSDVKGGAAAFLDFALSQEMQTSEKLTDEYFPVTRGAAEVLLRKYHYYYPKDETEWQVSTAWDSTVGDVVITGISLTPSVYEIPPDEAYPGIYRDFGETHTEVVLTEEDIAHILLFFDTCAMYGGISSDTTVAAILEEELSAYRSGAKSLEEVTALIQSRVWIYLNE